MDIGLSQIEADRLLVMPKRALDAEIYSFPSLGGSENIKLCSLDEREAFYLDIANSRIQIKKFKLQNRARRAFILARLDWGGAPHRNPDGEEISCPHLHVYRDGYADKWAQPLPPTFQNLSQVTDLLSTFLSFCHVVQPPHIEFGFA